MPIGLDGVVRQEEWLDVEGAALMMDCDIKQVLPARTAGHIVGLPSSDGSFRFPDWQFRYDGQPFPDVSNVMEAVGNDHLLAYLFMTSTHTELAGRTAEEYLRSSRSEDLADVARRWLSKKPDQTSEDT